MELDDVDLDALAVVIGLGDAGVLGRHAEAAAPGVGALRLAGRARGLGHDEVAGAVMQVHQIEQVDIGLDERVVAADAAVRPAISHKGGRVGRAHDHILHVTGVHDEAAAGVAKVAHGQARALEQVDRRLEEGALGHRDAQRALPRRLLCHDHARSARLAEHLLQTLQREGETAGRDTGTTELVKHGVVAAARCERGGDAIHVGLEDQPRVVIERIDNREIEGQVAICEQIREARGEVAQLSSAACILRNTSIRQQPVDLVDDLDAARQTRQLAERPRRLPTDRTRRLALGDDLVERNVVRDMHDGTHPTGELLVGRTGIEQGVQGNDRAADDLPVRDARRVERCREQARNLSFRRRSVLADQLDTQLGELAGLAAQVGLLADHRRLVAQAQRQVAIGEARRDHTGNRKRDVGAHDQQLVIIKKLEGSVVQRRTALEHIAILHERRLDREVAVLGKAHLHRLRDALALQRLPG